LEKFEVCCLVGWEGARNGVSSQERSIKQGRRYPKDVKSRSKPRSRENECGVRIEGWSEVEELLVKKDHEVGVSDRGGDCWKENAKTLNLDNFDGLARYGSVQGCARGRPTNRIEGPCRRPQLAQQPLFDARCFGGFQALVLESVEEAKTSIPVLR
jgi:hypothetical protein